MYISYTSNTETKLQKLYHRMSDVCKERSLIGPFTEDYDYRIHLHTSPGEIYLLIHLFISEYFFRIGGWMPHEEENQVLRKLSVGHIKILFR